MQHKRNKSAAYYVITALVPYTEANLKLVFKPSLFFQELSKRSRYKERSLQNEYYRLKKDGLVEIENGRPHLTNAGIGMLQLYEPVELVGAGLMVVFDIPEAERNKRAALRALLRQLKFVQIQKSVWMTKYECREYLKAEILRLDLANCVQIFESQHLKV